MTEQVEEKGGWRKVRGRDIKQLLDDVEHDIMNYQNRGLCYLPKTKAEADNTDTTSGLLSMLRSDWLSY